VLISFIVFYYLFRMAGRLLSRITRSSYFLAARGQIRQGHHAAALPTALRDEYYPKLGMFIVYACIHVCHT